MKIIFKYDLQKDTENFLKSFNSVNNKKPTKLQELYIETIGEVVPEKVSEFLQNQVVDVTNKLERIKSDWERVEIEVLGRMTELFNVSLSADVVVYLSANSRCTYNIKENYFFVYMNSEKSNCVIAHELLHFYTWSSFYEELMQKGISGEQYNNIKESLTELLNTDFQDILDGQYDKGYPQHLEMRKRINHLRKEGKDINFIVDDLR